MKNFAVALFLIALPLTSAFSVSQYISVSMIGTIIAAVLLIPYFRFSRIATIQDTKRFYFALTFLTLLMAIVICISSITSDAISEPARHGHILSRFAFAVLIILLGINFISLSSVSVEVIRKSLIVSFGLTFVICVWDLLVLYGMSGIAIPRATVPELEATFRGFLLRVRGPAEEPGHLAAYIAATVPIFASLSKYPIRWIVVATSVGFIFTLSASLLIWFFVYLTLLIAILSLKVKPKLSDPFALLMLVGKVLLVVLAAAMLIVFVLVPLGVVDKFNSTSFEGRYESLSILENLTTSAGAAVFGLGPGVYKVTGSAQPINFIGAIVIELGITGVAVFIAFYFSSVVHVMRSGNAFLIAGLFAYSVFFLAIGNYWYPFFSVPLFYGMIPVRKTTRETLGSSVKGKL